MTPTHIRLAAKFKKDCSRSIGHIKSHKLWLVIRKLEVYHANTGNDAVRDHLLMELRDAVTGWAADDAKDFAARRGPELAHEVMVELASRRLENLKLVDGDILFRWIPRGISQRGLLQAVISAFQGAQDDRQHMAYGEGTNLQDSAFLVEHVGIYAGGNAIEIGFWGLERKPVAGRDNYDLVVRSRSHGVRIADVAKSARHGSAYSEPLQELANYPVWDLPVVGLLPLPGARGLAQNRRFLEARDHENQQRGLSSVLQQRVICSHFVNAVLYAAIMPGGTLATATDHHFDHVFKVSPAQMWQEFMSKRGIWALTHAVFIGVQHKGNLHRNMDPRKLGVGLTAKPVPKKADRATA